MYVYVHFLCYVKCTAARIVCIAMVDGSLYFVGVCLCMFVCGCYLHYYVHMILDSDSGSTKLDEVTIGMVVGKLGNPGPMSRRHGNYFIHDLDRPMVDSATSAAINFMKNKSRCHY